MGELLKPIKGKTYKVVVTASNGKTKTWKTKGNFDVPFNSLAPSIKSNYFFKQRDLDFINKELVPMGCSAYDARIFIIGGRNSQITSTKIDGRSNLGKTLPFFHWDNTYQFIMDNATQEDVNEWLK